MRISRELGLILHEENCEATTFLEYMVRCVCVLLFIHPPGVVDAIDASDCVHSLQRIPNLSQRGPHRRGTSLFRSDQRGFQRTLGERHETLCNESSSTRTCCRTFVSEGYFFK